MSYLSQASSISRVPGPINGPKITLQCAQSLLSTRQWSRLLSGIKFCRWFDFNLFARWRGCIQRYLNYFTNWFWKIKVLRHLMFNCNMRRYYLPDMISLQEAMYQLSRLLADLHPDLYAFLEFNGISPVLYLTPWFLTCFASNFPLNFAVRVLGKVSKSLVYNSGFLKSMFGFYLFENNYFNSRFLVLGFYPTYFFIVIIYILIN